VNVKPFGAANLFCGNLEVVPHCPAAQSLTVAQTQPTLAHGKVSQNKIKAIKENTMHEKLTLTLAEQIVKAALKKSEDMNLRMDIAVVDAGGNLKAFVRMDNAWLGSIDICIKKARTARFFDMPTAKIGELSQPGGSLFGIEHSNAGLITFGGGLPLQDGEGNIIGAIGVSGSSVENDVKVAQAGVEVCAKAKSATA
jgi:uncharacterized protein GlcG (DUF336 family)